MRRRVRARGASRQNFVDRKMGVPALDFRDESELPPAKVKPILVIVDDEADVLQSVQNLLRMAYQVVTFQRMR